MGDWAEDDKGFATAWRSKTRDVLYIAGDVFLARL